ncbi:ribonuclease H [Cyanobium sp. ATX 6F1]|uniref:ribonuclease H family protein n=1 Tax=Cyanobium sp. ATX 6F1 TaxID=2823702 RepID=UPI0020CDF37E|nr:ribonuclease H [Cyanobium sp. ATX 6F1]MCP9916400.1 ribonuclease HI [Cyanobium sp. ATX 6F1]
MATEAGRVVTASCDGACSGNPGPGGWGALLRFEDGTVREFGGWEPATTNNRMELTAALALLETLADLPRHPALAIRTDSRYLIDGFSKWMAGWKRKGWRTASGGAVLNRELWEALDRARLADVPFVHVKGHSGDPDNDRCDAIAVAYSRGGRPALAGSAPAAEGPPAPIEDLAPAPLQALLNRLELADRLARGGYGLSAVELAQLVEQPLAKVQDRQRSWRWRDWQVRPEAEGRWRLVREVADG